eukprot:1191333-Prorocentrum_minimum.AAC.1
MSSGMSAQRYLVDPNLDSEGRPRPSTSMAFTNPASPQLRERFAQGAAGSSLRRSKSDPAPLRQKTKPQSATREQGHKWRHFGPFDDGDERKGNVSLQNIMRQPVRTLWAPVPPDPPNLETSTGISWQATAVCWVPKLPAEMPEELDELEIANSLASNNNPIAQLEDEDKKPGDQPKHRGILRPSWTPQHGLKGVSFFRNILTGELTECTCNKRE